MTSAGSDVVVIGGGIVGTAAAAFLAAAGASVTLVEGEGLASGASGANSGVVQHPFDPVLAGLVPRDGRRCIASCRRPTSGFRLPDEPAGLLYLSADEAAVRQVDRALAEAFPELDRSVVSGDRARAAGAGGGRRVCRLAGSGSASRSTRALRPTPTPRSPNGAVRGCGSAATATLALRGDAVTGVVVDGRMLACDAVLVAAGPWSPEIIDPTGRWAPIRHRWGVVVEAELAIAPTHVLEDAEIGSGDRGRGRQPPRQPATRARRSSSSTSASCRWPGVASVGSTFLAREPDPAAWVEPILGRASAFVPALADAPIRGTRSCARPQSADGRPLIGRVPGRRGTVHLRRPRTRGASRRVRPRLAWSSTLMLGREPAIPPDLDPARFEAPG